MRAMRAIGRLTAYTDEQNQYTVSMHPVHCQYASSTLSVCIQYTVSMHPVHCQYASSTLSVCIQYTVSMHPVHCQYASSTLSVCIQYTVSMHPVHRQYTTHYTMHGQVLPLCIIRETRPEQPVLMVGYLCANNVARTCTRICW